MQVLIFYSLLFGVFWGHAVSRPDFSSRDGIGTGLSAAPLRAP